MNRTTIEWTHWSVTPLKLLLPDGSHVNFCIKCSEGCKFCYAESNVRRWWKKKWGPFPGYTKALLKIGKPVLIEEDLQQVLKLDRKIAEGKADPEINKVFWNDMTDEFGGFWPEQFIDQMMVVRALTPNLIHQVLTKRPERMAAYFDDGNPANWTDIIESMPEPKEIDYSKTLLSHQRDHCDEYYVSARQWPFPNVWLGTSIENQKAADERIPHLLKCPAAVRFLSVEPLLGPVRLDRIEPGGGCDGLDCLSGGWHQGDGRIYERYSTASGEHAHVDWVIVGGESGAGARSCYVNWIDDIVAQCKAAGVPVFVKQLGANVRCIDDEFGDIPIKLKDKKGGDIDEFPVDLRIREFPRITEGVPA